MHIVTQNNNTPVLGESWRVGVRNSCHWSQRLNSDTTTCCGGGVGERGDDDRRTRSLFSVGGAPFL